MLLLRIGTADDPAGVGHVLSSLQIASGGQCTFQRLVVAGRPAGECDASDQVEIDIELSNGFLTGQLYIARFPNQTPAVLRTLLTDAVEKLPLS